MLSTRLVPLILVALACALSACGASDESSSSAGSESSSSAGSSSSGPGTAAAGGAEAGAFPVTIQHKYGSTTIKAAPKRVVVVGLREQDALLALGVDPVATTEWFGKHPGAIFPWAKAALGKQPLPTVLTDADGINVEKVAALRPDLIVGIYSGLKKGEYAALSKLAPVVAQPKGEVDYGSSWQEETLIAGQAVGRPAKARQLVAQNEKVIAAAAAAHPEFKGQTAANISDYQGIFVYGAQDVRSRMLTDLGFTYPPALRKAFTTDFGGQLPDEKVDAIDVGALIWFADGDHTPAQLKRAPVYSKLKVRKEGRDVFITGKDRVYEATSFPTVLSIPGLVKELVPRLAAAADGDPSTSTDQQPAS